MRTLKGKRDALDQLLFEDKILVRLLGALHDEGQNRRRHGRTIKVFVERMAVRQAARELVVEAVASIPELSGLSTRLHDQVPEARQRLDRLDELTRGVASTNLNQAQDVDAAIAAMEPLIRADMSTDLRELIPAVSARFSPEERRKVLPSAGYVLRHCPLHPGAHPRRWYEHIGPIVWVHAVYDYLRNLPVGGVKPTASVLIPGEGAVTPESVESRDSQRT